MTRDKVVDIAAVAIIVATVFGVWYFSGPSPKVEPWPEPPKPLASLDDVIRLTAPPEEPKAVRELPGMSLGPNGRVHRIVGPDGEAETKTIHRLAVEMRIYAADGTFTVVDETVFSNSFRGDEITGVWK